MKRLITYFFVLIFVLISYGIVVGEKATKPNIKALFHTNEEKINTNETQNDENHLYANTYCSRNGGATTIGGRIKIDNDSKVEGESIRYSRNNNIFKPRQPHVPASILDLILDAGSRSTFDPNNYRNVNIGDESEIIISGGKYFIHNLNIEKSVTFLIQGDAFFNVIKEFNIDENFNVLNPQGRKVIWLSRKDFEIENSNFYGEIVSLGGCGLQNITMTGCISCVDLVSLKNVVIKKERLSLFATNGVSLIESYSRRCPSEMKYEPITRSCYSGDIDARTLNSGYIISQILPQVNMTDFTFVVWNQVNQSLSSIDWKVTTLSLCDADGEVLCGKTLVKPVCKFLQTTNFGYFLYTCNVPAQCNMKTGYPYHLHLENALVGDDNIVFWDATIGSTFNSCQSNAGKLDSTLSLTVNYQ